MKIPFFLRNRRVSREGPTQTIIESEGLPVISGAGERNIDKESGARERKAAETRAVRSLPPRGQEEERARLAARSSAG